MNKEIIGKLETLVEEISRCYQCIPKEKLDELNELTQSGWSEEEYIEYCAEYWSRRTLEETVYALLHEGKYPDNNESAISFWRCNKQLDLPDDEILYKLQIFTETGEEDFIEQFEDLPVREWWEWLRNYCLGWNIRDCI